MTEPDLPDRIVLFDGICAVCDAGMTWLIDHDPEGRLHYAPLQGETAALLKSRHPAIPEGVDTIVFVYRVDGAEHVALRTDALLRIVSELPAPWRWLRVLRVLPRWLRDPLYDAFAAVRYRLFGTLDGDRCRLPDEREAALMLP